MTSFFGEKLKKFGYGLTIEPAEVWALKNSLIQFPEDRIPGAKRTEHEFRTVFRFRKQMKQVVSQ